MAIARFSGSSTRLVLFAFLLGLGSLAGCDGGQASTPLTGGDPRRGREIIPRYGCQTCHAIPRVQGADGTIGPSLDGIGSRPYLAGRLANTPENLLRWIRDPQSIEPGTAMPDLNVTEQDSRDIGAYLYTLK